MEKDKLISFLNEYKDIPDKIANFTRNGEISVHCTESRLLIPSITGRKKSAAGKSKIYYEKIYNIIIEYEKILYIFVEPKTNIKSSISIYFDIERQNLLFVIDLYDEKLHPGLFIPNDCNIEQWKPKNWD